MVNNIAEAVERPVSQGSTKPDQPADGTDFMAMLVGMVPMQPGATGVTPGNPEEAIAQQPAAPQSQLSEPTLPQPVVTGITPGIPKQAIAEQPVAPLPKLSEPTPRSNPLVSADIQQTAKNPLAGKNGQEAVVGQSDAVLQQEVLPDNAPVPARSPEPEVIRVLKDSTTVRSQQAALPVAARYDREIAASMVAFKLIPEGQNAQAGGYLPQANGQDQALGSATDNSAKNTIAPVIAGNRNPEQASNEGGTRVQVDWKPSEPIVISTSPGGGSKDSLQFANGNTREPEASKLPGKEEAPQSFGVEMKAQSGIDSVKPAEPVYARVQIDPAIGEKVVSQIAKEVTLSKLGESTTLSIRLDPPELGTLRVHVTTQSGVLTTQLESPNAAVRSLLETHLPALKDALSNAGIEVSKFSVSTGLDLGQQAARHQQTWQPTRTVHAAVYAPEQHDESTIQAALSGAGNRATSYSWLA